MDPPAYIKAKIPEPSMDMSKMTPEQYKIIGTYKPEVAPYIAESRPDLVKETAGMKEGRDAQLTALRRLKSIGSNQEGDPELQQAIADAGKKSQIQAQSRSQSILQDLARRGMMGSGAGLAAQLQGSSDAMETAARSSQDAAVSSYKNKLQALKDSAMLGGQVRGDDLAMEGRNVDIINDFNQRTSKNRQVWENARTGTLNDAQRMNLNAAQSVADQNVGQNNKYALSERDRQDQLQKYLYGIRSDEQNRQNSLIGAEATWNRDERNNQNKLAGDKFSDQLAITSGKNGLAAQGIAQTREAAQDRNQLYQGIGNSVTGGIQSAQDREDKVATMDRADARETMTQDRIDARIKDQRAYEEEQRKRQNGGY